MTMNTAGRFQSSPSPMRAHAKLKTGSWFSVIGLSAFLFCFSLVPRSRADGGAVQMQATNGPFRLTLFSDPGTLRAGLVDFSAFVERLGSDQPVLGGAVSLNLVPLETTSDKPTWIPPICLNTRLTAAGPQVLTRGAGGNSLFYSSLVRVPAPGEWRLDVTVLDGGDKASFSTVVKVQSPLPLWTAYAHLLAIPVVGVLIFAWRERKKG
jgi:hypothetical protein